MRPVIFILALILCGCTDFLDTWVTYHVKKGENYFVKNNVEKLVRSQKDGRHMSFQARFSTGCDYDLKPLGKDSLDWHKLYGFTDCNAHIHEHSSRFGWRHKGGGVIEVAWYVYRDGEPYFEKIGETVLYRSDDYDIWAKDDLYRFTFNNVKASTKRTQDCDHGFRFRCWPYAEHDALNDMTIMIKEID